MATFEVQHHKKPFDRDILRVKGGEINAQVNILLFIDADTGQHVCYIPSLDISGYGETEEKAKELCRFSVREYLSYLNSLSQKKKEQELREMGWKSGMFKSKEFSKAFVNSNGELQNLNAVGGKVERLSYEIA